VANLDTLDPTQPNGAIITVAQLDDYEREGRQKLKDWALIEHLAKGSHKLPIGTVAERDAYYTDLGGPVKGNIWIEWTTGTAHYFQIYNPGGGAAGWFRILTG
jgi:hypothetical protein